MLPFAFCVFYVIYLMHATDRYRPSFRPRLRLWQKSKKVVKLVTAVEPGEWPELTRKN